MKRILILFFLAVTSLAISQSKFYNINEIHGISLRETYSICKDDNGFIWASAKTGIIRITENDYRIYQLPLEATNVHTIKLEYYNSTLIAFTNNGQFFVYDKLFDCFTLMINMIDVLENHFISVNSVVFENTNSIWVSTSFGLYRIDNNSLQQIHSENIQISYISAYNENYLFIATLDGIGLFDKQSCKIDYLYTYTIRDEMSVSMFLYDEDTRKLWVGTISNGLFYYDMTSKSLLSYTQITLPKQPILALKKDIDDTILIGFDGQGMWQISSDGNELINIYRNNINDTSSLQGNGVYDIFCDDNKVWVTTFTGGVSWIDRQTSSVHHITHNSNNHNSLINNDVNNIIEDQKSNIWMATNNGISRWNVANNKWYTYISDKQDQSKVFLALCEDSNGNMWAGTYSSGVYVLDGDTGKILYHYFNDIKFVSDIYKDTQGNIWIGGPNFVVVYLEKEKRFQSYGHFPLCTFQELSSDIMLLGCTYGLIALDKHTGTTEMLVHNYLIKDILVLKNDIWIATSGEGIIQYNCNTKSINKYKTESGIISNYVNSILYTEDYLWLGTENGLCQFSLNEKLAFTYPLSLSTISFNQNSCWKLNSGKLIFGTNKGCIIFDPKSLQKTKNQGQLFFQDIRISGQSIRENKNILKNIPVNEQNNLILKYNQNNFALEFLPIGRNITGSKFSWKLKGIDNNWSHPSPLQYISYFNLPTGNYEFKVRMYDNSLSQIIDERTLSVQIMPPFWATLWFRLIFIWFIIMVLIYLLRTWSNHLKQRHIKDKIYFFINMAHDIRTSLTLISAPIEQLNKDSELSEKSRYYLNLATEQSSHLSSVVTQLLDFEKVDAGKGQLFLVMTDIVKLVSQRRLMFETNASKKNIKITYSSNQESYITGIDVLKIEKVIDNLISNAIKYSHHNSNIEVSLLCKDDLWNLEVKDYGMGISENAKSKLFKEFYRGDNVENSRIVGSGIGLLLVKSYVSMHGGRVFLESKENLGSTFNIRIPYIEVKESITQTNFSKIRYEFISENQIENQKPRIQEEEKKQKKNIHLLIVEDNIDLQSFLVHSLKDWYYVNRANDGKEAWDMIQRKNPDIVISDIRMPNMDGLELCKLLKSTFETSHIPIILLTSLSEKTKQLEGLGLGADDYITKPFDLGILTERINSILENRKIVIQKTLKLINIANEQEDIFTNELNDQFVKKAFDIINMNISNIEFGKTKFASAMNVSPSLLYVKIKSLTGQSPIELIKTIRFNKSLELLKTKKYTITEISEMCGFSSANYFTTAFKKHFGKPPTEILN